MSVVGHRCYGRRLGRGHKAVVKLLLTKCADDLDSGITIHCTMSPKIVLYTTQGFWGEVVNPCSHVCIACFRLIPASFLERQ
jgi:hypothetical protein